jgi:hypothetical protein
MKEFAKGGNTAQDEFVGYLDIDIHYHEWLLNAPLGD